LCHITQGVQGRKGYRAKLQCLIADIFAVNFANVNEALIGVYTVEQIVPSPAVEIFNYSILFY